MTRTLPPSSSARRALRRGILPRSSTQPEGGRDSQGMTVRGRQRTGISARRRGRGLGGRAFGCMQVEQAGERPWRHRQRAAGRFGHPQWPHHGAGCGRPVREHDPDIERWRCAISTPPW